MPAGRLAGKRAGEHTAPPAGRRLCNVQLGRGGEGKLCRLAGGGQYMYIDGTAALHLRIYIGRMAWRNSWRDGNNGKRHERAATTH